QLGCAHRHAVAKIVEDSWIRGNYFAIGPLFAFMRDRPFSGRCCDRAPSLAGDRRRPATTGRFGSAGDMAACGTVGQQLTPMSILPIVEDDSVGDVPTKSLCARECPGHAATRTMGRHWPPDVLDTL